MTLDDLTYREEELTTEEKKTLFRRFVGTLIFGGLMGGGAFYFLFVFNFSPDFRIPLIVFSVFFYGILAFILYIHGSNAFQKTKRIYEGTVTAKHARSGKLRNSNQNTSYCVELDGVEFTVDLAFYNICMKGDHIRLKVLKKTRVFDLEVIPKTQSLDAREMVREQRLSEQTEEFMPSEFLSIIRTRLLRAFVFRTLVGSVVGFILFYIILFVGLIALRDRVERIVILYYVSLGLSIGLVLLLNRRTIRYIRDLMTKKIIFVFEKVLDVQESNMPKPGPNSIRTYQGYTYRDDLFCYVRTANHWIEITPQLSKSLAGGDVVKIGLAKYSKVVLSVEKFKH